MRVLLILFITIFFSCKSNEATTQVKVETKPQNIIFSELNSGTNSGFTKKENRIITDQNSYNEVWTTAFEKYSNKQKPGRIDFEKSMVILVAMGIKNSGGYNIKISSIEENQNNIVVTIEESKPGKTCMTTSVMTFPYQIVELKKSTKEILFKTVEKIYECEK